MAYWFQHSLVLFHFHFHFHFPGNCPFLLLPTVNAEQMQRCIKGGSPQPWPDLWSICQTVLHSFACPSLDFSNLADVQMNVWTVFPKEKYLALGLKSDDARMLSVVLYLKPCSISQMKLGKYFSHLGSCCPSTYYTSLMTLFISGVSYEWNLSNAYTNGPEFGMYVFKLRIRMASLLNYKNKTP